jgi:hypothetical protein
MEDLKSRGNMIREENILWVITVPAIWNDGAKQFTREAAIMVGKERFSKSKRFIEHILILICYIDFQFGKL